MPTRNIFIYVSTNNGIDDAVEYGVAVDLGEFDFRIVVGTCCGWGCEEGLESFF